MPYTERYSQPLFHWNGKAVRIKAVSQETCRKRFCHFFGMKEVAETLFYPFLPSLFLPSFF
jgi:hypothetical protein